MNQEQFIAVVLERFDRIDELTKKLLIERSFADWRAWKQRKFSGWEESQHPRQPAGSATGGEFAPIQANPLLGDRLVHEGAAGGTQGAQWYKDPATGKRYIIKGQTYGDYNRVAAEALAGAVYKKLGIDVPNFTLTEMNGTPVIASEAMNGKPKGSITNDPLLKKGFMADVYVANWDVVGLVYDNILYSKDKAYRVDVGGTFTYRAQGGRKSYGTTPSEQSTLLDSKINPQSARAFGSISDSVMKSEAAHIANTLSDRWIVSAVNAAHFTNPAIREEVLIGMKGRRDWMGKFAGLKSYAWDESQHPRVPAGNPTGGEFSPGAASTPIDSSTGKSYPSYKAWLTEGVGYDPIHMHSLSLNNLNKLAKLVQANGNQMVPNKELPQYLKWHQPGTAQATAVQSLFKEGFNAQILGEMNGKDIVALSNKVKSASSHMTIDQLDSMEKVIKGNDYKVPSDLLAMSDLSTWNSKSSAATDGWTPLSGLETKLPKNKPAAGSWALKEKSATVDKLIETFHLTQASALAVMDGHDKWRQKLTNDETHAISRYSGSAHMEINDFLRFDKYTNDKTIVDLVKHATSAMNKAVMPVTVRNAVREFDIRVPASDYGFTSLKPAEAIKKFTAGAIWIDKGFISTTLHENGGYQLGGDSIRFDITVPKGAHAMYLDGSSEHPHEQEILLNRSTKFKINNVKMGKDPTSGLNQVHVKATVVP